MKLQEVIPYMVCINLAHREDRRREAWQRFADADLVVDRQPGVLKRTVTDPRGFHSAARYACSLAKRLAIRRAKLAGAPAVLLFEDDVVLAPDLHEQLAKIELPDDWGIFFLGCKHLRRPTVVAPGLVRVAKASDHHAIAIRREYFDAMIWAMAAGGKGCSRIIDYSDVKSSEMNSIIPSYACYPNLAWQMWSHSDNADHHLTHYSPTGRQKTIHSAVAGLDEEMAALAGNAAVPAEHGNSSDGALDQDSAVHADGNDELLTDGVCAVIDNAPEEVGDDWIALAEHPETLLESEDMGYGFLAGQPARHRLEESFPMRVYINLGRREDRRFELEYAFALQRLEVERFAAVDARWVRRVYGHIGKPQYGCAMSHRQIIRQARQRGAPAVLVFEDDAALHPEFRRIAEAHAPPPDWGVLFYGCMHVKDPVVVAPGWVKVTYAYSMHAYAVRERWYDRVLAAMRKPDPDGRVPGCDVALTRLSDEIPMYACYPNLSWQAPGYSDLRKAMRNHYDEQGRQRSNPQLVQRLEESMTGRCVATRCLTVEEVHTKNPPPKRSLEAAFPARFYVNLTKREDRRRETEDCLRQRGLSATRIAAVEGSLARNTRGYARPGQYGCAASHRLCLRAAEQSRADAVLIFEDDVVLHPDFRKIVETTEWPDDWALLYFGCAHLREPEPVARGIVRVTGAYGTFAYAVRGSYYREIRRAMNGTMKKPSGGTMACDVVLAELSKTLPAYGFYPNLAWVRPSHSDITGRSQSTYDECGRLTWPPAARRMRNVDGRMRVMLNEEGVV